mmetsp:Transcript_24201/g.60082  ORF Transcript_24201/g.60082 Transcript_24201/m.60082 type:complete len:216 (+) Transcript_24201:462-1109(+)
MLSASFAARTAAVMILRQVPVTVLHKAAARQARNDQATLCSGGRNARRAGQRFSTRFVMMVPRMTLAMIMSGTVRPPSYISASVTTRSGCGPNAEAVMMPTSNMQTMPTLWHDSVSWRKMRAKMSERQIPRADIGLSSATGASETVSGTSTMLSNIIATNPAPQRGRQQSDCPLSRSADSLNRVIALATVKEEMPPMTRPSNQSGMAILINVRFQ